MVYAVDGAHGSCMHHGPDRDELTITGLTFWLSESSNHVLGTANTKLVRHVCLSKRLGMLDLISNAHMQLVD